MKISKLILPAVVIIAGIVLAYAWYGFLFPDPYYLSSLPPLFRFIYTWATRLLIPLFYFAVVLALVFKNKQLLQNIGLLLLTLFVLLILVYPILDIAYFVKIQSRKAMVKEQYHSSLQLTPVFDHRLDHPTGKGAVKIFCLGGSTTEFKDSKGVGWPDWLEKELRQIYHTDSILVFNFGRQWYTTLHTLINYETNLRQYHPDVILLMHNINDLLQNADFSYLSNGPFRNDYGHFYGPETSIYKGNGLFGALWRKLTPMWYHKERMTFDQDTFPGLVPYTRNINTLIDLASLDSTKVILMTQPNFLSENMEEDIKRACNMVNFEAVGEEKRWGYKTAYVGMKQYNQRIKEIAGHRNVGFIDLEKRVPKSLVWFHDEVHYNDTTYRLVSEVITKEIIGMKVLSHLFIK